MFLKKFTKAFIWLLPSFVTALVFWLVIISNIYLFSSLIDLLGVPPGRLRTVIGAAPKFILVGTVFVGLGGNWSKIVWFVQSLMIAVWIVVQFTVVTGLIDGNLFDAFGVAFYVLVLYGWVVLPVSWVMLVISGVVERATGVKIFGIIRRMIPDLK